MKILIVSDTHGSHSNLKEVIAKAMPADLLIHCGDAEGGESTIRKLAGIPAYIVAGNNDYFSGLPRELEFTIGQYRILIVHGHDYGVSMGLEPLLDEAKSREISIVFFGHTHKPVITKRDGIFLINPGSLTYPRQEGRRPSFCVMDIDRFGEVHFTINYL